MNEQVIVIVIGILYLFTNLYISDLLSLLTIIITITNNVITIWFNR